MKTYYVRYKMYSSDEAKWIKVSAKNKVDAYEKATYTLIPEKENGIPYSAWVDSVIYSNGRLQSFNTFEGNPY